MRDFILRLIAKRISKKLQLKEGTVDKKEWWKSKTIISDIVTILIGLYASIGATLGQSMGWNLPPIPEWLFVILGALGIYGRTSATTTIGK